MHTPESNPDSAPESAPEVGAPARVRSTPARARAYQRRRLALSMGGGGSILGLLWVGVGSGAPVGLDRVLGGAGAWGGMLVAGALAAAAVGLQLPWDLMARRVDRRFRQLDDGDGVTPSTRADVTAAATATDRAWLVRVAVDSIRWVAAAMIGGLVLSLVHANAESRWLAWAILAMALVSGIAFALPIAPGPRSRLPADRKAWLVATREHLHRLGLGWPPIRWYDHGETSLAGGWHGLGPFARLWLARSIWDMPPAIAAGLIAREIGHADRGDRAFGVVGSVAWIAAGLALSAIVLDATVPGWIGAVTQSEGPPAEPGAAALVFVTAAVMSTWSLLGVLFWSTLGRAQVYAADRFMLRVGMTREEALAVLDALAARNRPDERRPTVSSAICHPIPAMEDRRAALRGLGDGDDDTAPLEHD